MPGDTDPSREPLLGSSSQQITYVDRGNESHSRDHGHPARIVHFFPGDLEDPRNWPRWKKWLMIGPILLIDLSVSWGASGFSPASRKFAHEFGLPAGLGTLGLSSYVLGLAFGPMTLAPLSEVSQSKDVRVDLSEKSLRIDSGPVLRKATGLYLFLLHLPLSARSIGTIT